MLSLIDAFSLRITIMLLATSHSGHASWVLAVAHKLPCWLEGFIFYITACRQQRFFPYSVGCHYISMSFGRETGFAPLGEILI